MKIAKFLLPLAMSASLLSGVAMAQSETSIDSAPAPQTQVEIKNEAPAAQAPAAPNIDIDMPKAPDVNVTMPGSTSTNTETRTEHSSSTTIIDDTDDAEPVTNNSLWLYVLFGVLAIFLVVAMISAGSRRTVVSGGRSTTIIDD